MLGKKKSHMKELKVIYGAHILSKNKDRQRGRLRKKLGGETQKKEDQEVTGRNRIGVRKEEGKIKNEERK